jgi:hypothetical protein
MTRGSSVFVVALAAVGACDLYATFDDRRLVCAAKLDDFQEDVDWDDVQSWIDDAVENRWVLNLYAHAPGVTISYPTLERALHMFQASGLTHTTYRDLDPSGEPFAGIALSFDDDYVDEWTEAAPLFEASEIHVTFFVTRYQTYSDDQKAKVRALADAGHAIESHSMTHANAVKYADEHGVDAYVRDEVLPSFDALHADGYPSESFAYPGGSRSDELDAAILPHVKYLRTTAGPCPY